MPWSNYHEYPGHPVLTTLDVTAVQSFKLRSRNAFAITDTELNVIAALAIMGESKIPNTGNRTSAAIGTPTTL